MVIKKAPDLRESEVTSAGSLHPTPRVPQGRGQHGAGRHRSRGHRRSSDDAAEAEAQNPNAQKLTNLKKSPFNTDEKLNSYKDVTTYNNFYEFGLDKADPARYAGHR